jgi:hypothetical protein
VEDIPREWGEWALVVQRTIEHYSGEMEISDIVYEVWNEPDLFGGWSTKGDRNYLELYEWSVKGAESAEGVSSFLIGGPATTGAKDGFMEDFLSYIEEKDLRLDFVSWHQYSKDLGVYKKDFAVINGVMSRHPELMQRRISYFITEIGPTGDLDSSYDSKFGAAHAVAIVRQALELSSRLYTFEIMDGRDPNGNEYWGRWGLLTHSDFGANEKPRYKAIQFLNKLSGRRLTIFGEGTWVKGIAARVSSGIVRMLVVNYDPYDKHVEEVPVTFEGLREGKYLLRKTLLGGGESEELIEVQSVLRMKTSVNLPANGVMLVEIEALQ